MTTPLVPIGELALNDSGAFKIGPFGSSLKKGELVSFGIPVAGIENVLPNQFTKKFRRFITLKKFDELSDYEILPGDVLVTTMGTIGRSAVVPPGVGRCIFDSHLFRMRLATNRVLPAYLCYALNGDLLAVQMERKARGAIMDGLNTTILRECLVPLPSLAEQHRIAAQLEQAERLRRTRRYTLELSDSFLPAAFRKMFGDSLRELPRWKAVPISELCKSITDCVNKTAPLADGPTPFKMIRTTNVRNGEVDLNTVRYVNEETFKTWTRRAVPQHGDVILTREAPLGEVGILKNPQNIFLGQRLVQYRADATKVTPEYLLHAFLSADLQHQLKRLGAGSTVEHIAVPDCETLMVMKPPLDLQQHFATLVAQHERLRATQRESLRQAEHLFQTLLHRAFNPE